jgi:hypothetical protein
MACLIHSKNGGFSDCNQSHYDLNGRKYKYCVNLFCSHSKPPIHRVPMHTLISKVIISDNIDHEILKSIFKVNLKPINWKVGKQIRQADPSPVVVVSEIEKPKIEKPEIEKPEIEKPKIEKPKIEKPEIEKPKIEKPKIEKPKRSRGDEYIIATSFLMEKKYTDEQICSLLEKTNPERDKKQIMKCISACRFFLNAGKRKCYDPKSNGKIERLFDVNGENLPKVKNFVKVNSKTK